MGLSRLSARGFCALFLNLDSRIKWAWLVALAVSAGLTGCGGTPMQFEKVIGPSFSTATGEKSNDGKFFFALNKSIESFKQDEFGPNTVTFQFEATHDGGGAVLDLQPDDIRITEGGTTPINKFRIESKTTKVGRQADIVFVIDSTGSMGPYINDVKTKVTSFVRDLEKTNIQANLCLVLFGDEIRRVCDRFVEDDVNTKKNENLESFLDSLNRVTASGGGDGPENQLLAMMTAAQNTPWHADAQRVMILVTDAPFHYAPDHLGDAPLAPFYQDALEAVANGGIKAFVVSPQGPGYNSDFEGQSSFVERSEGQWFDLSAIVKGTLSMTDIFKTIVDRLKAVYTVRYVCEENEGSNPALADADRVVTVEKSGKKPNIRFRVVAKSSTYPSGHPELKDRFPFNAEDVSEETLEVEVNGAKVPAHIEGLYIVLSTKPAPGASIRAKYLRRKIRDNLAVLPIVISSDSKLEEIQVVANGHSVDSEDFKLEQVDSSNFVLKLEERLLEGTNPLGIRERGGLEIEVRFKGH